MFLFVLPTKAQLLVETDAMQYEDHILEMDLQIPVISGLDPFADEVFTLAVRSAMLSFAHEILTASKMDYAYYEGDTHEWEWRQYAVATRYDVVRNDERFFSLTYILYQYTGGAHGMSMLSSLNVDRTTEGKIYFLNDLPLRYDFREIMIGVINETIAKEPENYFDPQVDYLPPGGFYLTAEGIVIFYQLYEIAPYMMGFPEFLIPWELVLDENR